MENKEWILEIKNEDGTNSKIEFQNKEQLGFYLRARGIPNNFVPCRKNEKGELEVIKQHDRKI